MTLEVGRLQLNREPKIHFSRPAIDPLFISAAQAYEGNVIGFILSGGGRDGAAGLRAIKERGGKAYVQHPEDALVASMPFEAIMADHPDGCLPIDIIAQRVAALCSRA